MKKFFSNTIVILAIAVVVGIAGGAFISEGGMKAVLMVKQVTGQIIFFLVPLIILGFITSSIARLKGNASRLLGFAFLIAYLSSVGAAFFSAGLSRIVIPLLHVGQAAPSIPLPENIFDLQIPPVMGVMSALLLSVFIGLGIIWIKSDEMQLLALQFRDIVLLLVERVLVPILPFYIASNFCALTYQGLLPQLKIFLPVLLIVILCHYVWLAFLYGLAALYSHKNSFEVLRYYLPAYLTALGTMSSAASLGVCLECAHKNKILDRDVVDFAIPLFNNIHLCGSVLTEVFFVSVVSLILYGHLPAVGSLVLFILLLGLFSVGAPGVPGGTVLASLGIVVSVLGFDDTGTALLITIFALQDSFGTACNITGDGALTLIVNTFIRRHRKQPVRVG